MAEFFDRHCPQLSDDVMKNESFISSFSKCVAKLSQFDDLHTSYCANTKRKNRKSKFKEDSGCVVAEVEKLTVPMAEAGAIELSISKGTSYLSVMSVKKDTLLSKILCSSLSILNIMVEKNILKHLRKRREEQGAVSKISLKDFTSTDVTISCRNSVSLSWEQAYNTFEVSGPVEKSKDVSLISVRYSAEQIENDTFVCVEDLNLNPHQSQVIIQAVVSNFPVLCVGRKSYVMMVDIHGLVLNGDAFTSLLNGEDPTSDESGKEDCLRVFGPRQKRGRKSLHEQYPELVSQVPSFIKHHSFSAHGRCRETTGTGVGVTLEQIRKHVIENIPELEEIGTDTIHRLMVAPRKNTLQAKRYKGLVEVRVPKTGRNMITAKITKTSISCLPK